MNVQSSRPPRARWSSSTWTSRRSTTPTTRRSMRRTARWWSSAATPRASGRGRGSATRSASPMGRARSRRSTSSTAASATRRSTFSSTAAPGGATRPPTTRCRPSRWSAPARTASSSTSSMSIEAGGDLFPMYEQVRRAHRLGVRATPRASAATATASIVSAHSSGSHLAGCVLTRGWQRGEPAAGRRQGRGAAVAACTISSRSRCRSARPM